MVEPEAFRKAADQFSDWRWRLNNLYWITDKQGKRTRFEMNWAQGALFSNMHYMNAILKARQLGFTTFIQIFMLDAAVFNSDIRAGTIAHTLLDAQTIFRDKVKFPYDQLPDGIRSHVPVIKDSATELMLANNSSIRVGTSLRSGTLQYLHVSEYGKLCAKYPEKAREVRTGALNTVQSGQVVFIESTAEGQEGHFFEVCQNAQTKQRAGARLTPLDFKFHFYSWHESPEYQIDPDGVVISDELVRYFAKLEATEGIKLTDAQKAWYAKKAENQLGDMKREYPSTPTEAFEASIEGAYYAEQMAAAELQGRIGSFPAHPGIPVHTVWDIGVGDYNSIWCFQITPARIRLVGYYHNSGEGMPHYIAELDRMAAANDWKLGRFYLPHDAKVQEWGSGRTRFEQVEEKHKDTWLIPINSVDDGINSVRQILGICEFDAGPTSEGTKALKNYRKEWDEERGIWRNKPFHNWASNGSDAFRYLAELYRDLKPEKPKPRASEAILVAQPDGSVRSTLTIQQLIDRQKKRRH
jgi:hypothetical protein